MSLCPLLFTLILPVSGTRPLDWTLDKLLKLSKPYCDHIKGLAHSRYTGNGCCLTKESNFLGALFQRRLKKKKSQENPLDPLILGWRGRYMRE